MSLLHYSKETQNSIRSYVIRLCCFIIIHTNHKELIENNFNGILFELNENELKIKFNRISLDSSLLNKLVKCTDKINKITH